MSFRSATAKTERPSTRARTHPFSWSSWKPFAACLIPLSLSVFYLTIAAPERVPVPWGVKVPFPALTRLLEPVCVWTGSHPFEVVGIAIALLVPGMVRRLFTERYYIGLAIILTAALTITYLSISAPIDRLIRRVEENIPQDRRVPEYHQKKPQD